MGRIGVCVAEVRREEAAPRPTLPTRGLEVKGLAEARPPLARGIAAFPGSCQGFLVLWLGSEARISQTKFQSASGLGSRLHRSEADTLGGLPAAAGSALWR